MNKNCFNNISEAIALNKNEILFCNGYFSIGYIEFDNEYNIKNLYYKNFKNKYFLGSTTLKILKNKKILYMGRKTNYMKEEENFGLTKIYILHFDTIKKDFVLETKINSFVTFFYEFKTKNEFLLNIKKDFYSIVNSKNIKVKKEFKFNINENIRILNDKYFIQIRKGKEINIFNLENFQLIKSSLSNELDTIQNIYASTNNIFFTLEKHFLEYSEDDNYFIKKWEFNEEKNEIIYLGYIKINEKTKILNKIKRINDKDNIYIIEYDLGFVIIKMFSN